MGSDTIILFFRPSDRIERAQVRQYQIPGRGIEIDELATGALDDLTVGKLYGRGILGAHSDLDRREREE